MEESRERQTKQTPSFTKVIFGDFLNAKLVRNQIWIFLVIVLFVLIYIAFRYQCQQDLLTIDNLEEELKDAKYKALSSSSMLTERYRESRIMEELKKNNDTTLVIPKQPPYIIFVNRKK